MDINKQKELLKTALHATDIYFGILKDIKKTGHIHASMEKQFFKYLDIAKVSLADLDVIHMHIGYIQKYEEIFNALLHIKSQEVHETVHEETRVAKFSSFLIEEKETPTDDDIDDLVNGLEWEDIFDLYGDHEVEEDDDYSDDEEEDKIFKDSNLHPKQHMDRQLQIDEEFSVQGRLKKKMSARKHNVKRNLAKNLKLKRQSNTDVLRKRAVIAARRVLANKILRGRNRSTLPASEKGMVEKRLKSMKYMQAALAVKLMPKIRTIEQKRLRNN